MYWVAYVNDKVPAELTTAPYSREMCELGLLYYILSSVSLQHYMIFAAHMIFRCNFGNAGGTLTGKYIKDSEEFKAANADRPAAKWRHTQCADFQTRYHFPVCLEAGKKYTALAHKYSLTPTELALAWANTRSFNASIIIGTTTVKQVIFLVFVSCCHIVYCILPLSFLSEIALNISSLGKL